MDERDETRLRDMLDAAAPPVLIEQITAILRDADNTPH